MEIVLSKEYALDIGARRIIQYFDRKPFLVYWYIRPSRFTQVYYRYQNESETVFKVWGCMQRYGSYFISCKDYGETIDHIPEFGIVRINVDMMRVDPDYIAIIRDGIDSSAYIKVIPDGIDWEVGMEFDPEDAEFYEVVYRKDDLMRRKL